MQQSQDPEEALVRYGANELAVLREGAFVRCAVTSKPIWLPELRYWNVALQEAYIDAAAATQRWRELNGHDRSKDGEGE